MKKTLNEQGRRPQVQPSESPPVLYEKWPLDLWSAAPIIRRRQWHPTPVTLPGKSHGRRSLVGCSPWGHEELDTTEWLHFHFLLSCIGEGNGNPLQCSCLENPRDGGAWWAAVYGVTQSRTWLKRLSSSSPYHLCHPFCWFHFTHCHSSCVRPCQSWCRTIMEGCCEVFRKHFLQSMGVPLLPEDTLTFAVTGRS